MNVVRNKKYTRPKSRKSSLEDRLAGLSQSAYPKDEFYEIAYEFLLDDRLSEDERVQCLAKIFYHGKNKEDLQELWEMINNSHQLRDAVSSI
jgi:hypothetical protein